MILHNHDLLLYRKTISFKIAACGQQQTQLTSKMLFYSILSTIDDFEDYRYVKGSKPAYPLICLGCDFKVSFRFPKKNIKKLRTNFQEHNTQ